MAAVAGAEIGHARQPELSRSHPRRVLIVEDDQPLAENLCEIVEMSGYDALAVSSAEAALEETAWRSGTIEVMSKPIDIEGLLSVIRRTLGPAPLR